MVMTRDRIMHYKKSDRVRHNPKQYQGEAVLGEDINEGAVYFRPGMAPTQRQIYYQVNVCSHPGKWFEKISRFHPVYDEQDVHVVRPLGRWEVSSKQGIFDCTRFWTILDDVLLGAYVQQRMSFDDALTESFTIHLKVSRLD